MPRKPKVAGSTAKDELIMNTNNSCIVSKRSVEKIYHKQDYGFRHFVKKLQRRSPLINRGYWLRMRAIEHAVRSFIRDEHERRPDSRPVVVNLGCGYDVLPFKMLSESPDTALFIDIDYPDLVRRKCKVIFDQADLVSLLGAAKAVVPPDPSVLMCTSSYIALGCDLSDVHAMDRSLRSVIADGSSILFLAEVSMTYMEVEAADAVIKWASNFENARFCLLEQCLPEGEETPFARTMLKHFAKLQSPLKTVLRYPTIFDQDSRFTQQGWQKARVRTLWDLWNDEQFMPDHTAEELDAVEPFDEWEEFALFAQHYFLLIADRSTGFPPMPQKRPTSPRQSSLHRPTSGPHTVELALDNESTPTPRHHAASFCVEGNIVVYQGGQGVRGRARTADLMIKQPEMSEPGRRPSRGSWKDFAGFPPDVELVCHTVVSLGSDQSLLVGGRTSPRRASSVCLRRRGSTWAPVHNLPEGRFRHTAVPVQLGTEGRTDAVLVTGGKTGDGRILEDFLLWQDSSGWQRLQTSSTVPCPRFGATAVSFLNGRSGYLLGGLDKRGKVLQDFWRWQLAERSDDWMIDLVRVWDQPPADLTQHTLGRFGAVLVGAEDDTVYLIGGVGRQYIDANHDVIKIPTNFDVTRVDYGVSARRPLLVGHSAEVLGVVGRREVIILGGGATCFSFGTYWNDACYSLVLGRQERSHHWRVMGPDERTAKSVQTRLPKNALRSKSSAQANSTKVTECRLIHAAEFEAKVNQATPVIFTNLDIGPCVRTWDAEYLTNAIGADRPIVIHEASTPELSFVQKTFSYSTIPFSSFISRASNGEHLYLRSLAADKPSKTPANLANDFPNLAPDLRLPPELSSVTETLHSSVLRISGPVSMWLHYDVMSNIYLQITGHKRIVLFHPSQVLDLGFAAGASSSDLRIFDGAGNVDVEIQRRGLRYAIADLKAGDVLFIPACWPHATTSVFSPSSTTTSTATSTSARTGDQQLSTAAPTHTNTPTTPKPTDSSSTTPTATTPPPHPLSTALNIFFRHLPSKHYAAGRDVYGNRDIAAYENGRRDVQKIVRGFGGVPGGMREFYLRRLVGELEGEVEKGEGSGDE